MPRPSNIYPRKCRARDIAPCPRALAALAKGLGSASFCTRWWLIQRPTIGRCAEEKRDGMLSSQWDRNR